MRENGSLWGYAEMLKWSKTKGGKSYDTVPLIRNPAQNKKKALLKKEVLTLGCFFFVLAHRNWRLYLPVNEENQMRSIDEKKLAIKILGNLQCVYIRDVRKQEIKILVNLHYVYTRNVRKQDIQIS